jgi:hypothetical protein
MNICRAMLRNHSVERISIFPWIYNQERHLVFSPALATPTGDGVDGAHGGICVP